MQVKIENQLGLHARLAYKFAEMCKQFNSDIIVSNNMGHGDGKEIMDILSLSPMQGSIITIEANGKDEDDALDSLVKYIRSLSGS